MQRPCPETNVLREGKQSVCETAGSHKPEVGYQIFRCLPSPDGVEATTWSRKGWALLHSSLGQTEAFRLPLAQP